MRIRRLHRIFALSMAFLMLGVSAGFSADFHYCQGEFKNFALYKKAKSCHELAAMKASCHMSSDEKTSCHSAKVKCSGEEKEGCCTNDTVLVQLDVDFGFGAIDLDTTIDSQFNIFVFNQNQVDKRSQLRTKVQYLNYKPPLIVVDKTIRYQSFLC